MRPSLLVALIVAAPAAAGPEFAAIEVPEHVYDGGWEHYVGGGLAAFDCDGDGLPELAAAGGSNPVTLLRNRSRAGGDLAFDAESLAITGVTGLYPLDIDGDGRLDLAVLRAGPNLLLRGEGDCRFSRFDSLGFASGEEWTTAFSATWEAGRALPSLAFGNYVDRDDPDGPFGTCDTNRLYRPAGGRYAPPLALDPGYCPLSMLFTDWDRSGRADLRISNDRHYYVNDGEEQMWAMETAPRLYTAQEGWQSHRLWGMGIAARDLDRDGRPEVFLTSMGDQRLQTRTGDGAAFADVPYTMGTTAHRPYLGGDGRPSTGWHVAFGDVQNDGRDDILIVKGNVEQMPDSAWDDPNNLLVQQPDGRFVETGGEAGIASLERGRGGALVDLNADGLLDIAVVNRRAPLEVWQNVTKAAGSWLELALSQPGANTFAVGAWIEIRLGATVASREITVGGGHAGGQAGIEHFGLGKADEVDLRVIWPDGEITGWHRVAANRVLALRRTATGLDISP